MFSEGRGDQTIDHLGVRRHLCEGPYHWSDHPPLLAIPVSPFPECPVASASDAPCSKSGFSCLQYLSLSEPLALQLFAFAGRTSSPSSNQTKSQVCSRKAGGIRFRFRFRAPTGCRGLTCNVDPCNEHTGASERNRQDVCFHQKIRGRGHRGPTWLSFLGHSEGNPSR